MKKLAMLCAVLALAACSSSADYPGVSTNATIGKASSNVVGSVSSDKLAREAFVYTKPLPSGDNEVCVGTWCSCAAE